MRKRLSTVIIGCAAVLLPLFVLLSVWTLTGNVSKPSARREGTVLSPVELGPEEKIKIEYTSTGCRSWCTWFFEVSGGDSARLVVIDGGGSYESGTRGPPVASPVGVVQLTKSERRGLWDLLQYYRAVPEQSLGTTENRIVVEYYRGAEKVGEERFVEGGLAEYWVYRKDQPESYNDAFDPRVTRDMVSFRTLFRRAWREANQALEPTTTAVTHRACARCAPAVAVAHLKRSAIFSQSAATFRC